VELPGFTNDVQRYLSSAHIFLQTSADEGLAYSVLEALAAGLPVVATRAGATDEAVEHRISGLLAEVDDEDSPADALSFLAARPELRQEFGRRGADHHQARFLFDDMILNTMNAYTELCRIDLSPEGHSSADAKSRATISGASGTCVPLRKGLGVDSDKGRLLQQ